MKLKTNSILLTALALMLISPFINAEGNMSKKDLVLARAPAEIASIAKEDKGVPAHIKSILVQGQIKRVNTLSTVETAPASLGSHAHLTQELKNIIAQESIKQLVPTKKPVKFLNNFKQFMEVVIPDPENKRLTALLGRSIDITVDGHTLPSDKVCVVPAGRSVLVNLFLTALPTKILQVVSACKNASIPFFAMPLARVADMFLSLGLFKGFCYEYQLPADREIHLVDEMVVNHPLTEKLMNPTCSGGMMSIIREIGKHITPEVKLTAWSLYLRLSKAQG